MNIRKQILAALLLLVAIFARAQTVEYIHTDALGSPVAVTNASGAVIERTVYEPYGAVINRPLKNEPGYTGHVADAVTGLNYMQQRYYDPGLGRFLSVDPVTATSAGGNFNRYWYANNNPYKFTDPDGRVPILVPVVIFVAKELAGEVFEQTTGLPAPTVKGLGKAVLKQAVKKQARDTIRSTRQLRGGTFRKAKEERINEAGGKCEYCQGSEATQGDHARTLNSYKKDVNEGRMSAAEAKQIANSKDNIVASCKGCNEVGKGTKDLGTGEGQYQPPNPNARVQELLDRQE